MVKDILKNIDQKTSEQLNRIEKEKERAILELEKKYQKEAKKIKENKLRELKNDIKLRIDEASQSQRLKFSFAVLEEKNRIVEEAYEKAEKKIVNMPDEAFGKLIASMLPDNFKGGIRAGKKTAAVLRKMVQAEIASDLEEEGFIVSDDEVELDFRISEVLRQLREKQLPEITKILF